MRLWKTPERLRRISYYLLLLLPMAMVASLLARRMPWWKWNPSLEWRLWGPLFVGMIAVWIGIRRTHRWALFVATLAFTGFVAYCLFISLRQENVALGLFSVFTGISAFAFLDRLFSAYHVPALAPGMAWFQSSPEPIPGLRLDWGEHKGLRMSRLDSEGGFVLGKFDQGAEKNLPTDILFHYRGTKMSCAVERVTGLPSKIDTSWIGIGVEFKNTDRDMRKELSDFIEVLRGEGHVIH